ncbi:hypothetical protein JOQ06_020210, partial [Pogonophryne albipinna]
IPVHIYLPAVSGSSWRSLSPTGGKRKLNNRQYIKKWISHSQPEGKDYGGQNRAYMPPDPLSHPYLASSNSLVYLSIWPQPRSQAIGRIQPGSSSQAGSAKMRFHSNHCRTFILEGEGDSPVVK